MQLEILFFPKLIQQRQADDLASQELNAQPIHIEELYDHGNQSVYLSEQFGSHEQLQHFKVWNFKIKWQKRNVGNNKISYRIETDRKN